MRLFISLILSLALIGCSQTTVHLNTRYLNDDQIKQVVDTIEDHNINVRVNNHPFPRQVDRSTLIHSPTMAIRHPERIDNVGIVNIIALKPLSQSSWLPSCKVEYGIRE